MLLVLALGFGVGAATLLRRPRHPRRVYVSTPVPVPVPVPPVTTTPRGGTTITLPPGTNIVLGRGAGTTAPASAPAPEADSPLSAKLDRYVDHCLNTISARVLRSRDRYLEWVDPSTGPTGRERNNYGIYDLGEDPSVCGNAIAEGNAMEPHLADLEAAATRYRTAYLGVAPLIEQAHQYYEREDYNDDHMARGRAMHTPLMNGFTEFAAANEALAQLVDALQDRELDALLARIEHDPARQLEFVMRRTYRAARQVELAGRGAEVARDGHITRVTFATLGPAVDAYAAALETMSHHAAQHRDETSELFGWSMYERACNDYLVAARQLSRRVRDNVPFDESDRHVIFAMQMGESVEGSPEALVSKYNDLVEAYNDLR